jgi:hypothetical protein
MPDKLAIPIILDRETCDKQRNEKEDENGETAVAQWRCLVPE